MSEHCLAYGWRAPVRWLLLIQFLSMGAMEMTGPFWPIYLRELRPVPGIPFAWIASAVYLAPMTATMLSAPWWGRLADRTGAKPMILRALIALAISQWWSAHADSATSVLLARTVQGGFAGFLAAAQIYAMRIAPADARRAVFADLQTITAGGSFLAPLVGALLVDRLGFRATNVIGAAVITLCIPLALRCLPATPSATLRENGALTAPARTGPRGTSPSGVVLGLLAGVVAVQAARNMPQTFLAPFVTETLHGSVALVGIAYGASAATLALSARWWTRRLADLSLWHTLDCIGLLTGLAALTTWWQGQVSGPIGLIAARLAWGICLGGLLSILNSLVVEASPDSRLGIALGLCSSAAKAGALLGLGVAALATGAFGWRSGFTAMTLVYALALAVLIGTRLLKTRAGRSDAPQSSRRE
ncbi:MFS transporter [Burkholderia gladioli]|uniref:MFS transporter n=1 Tax=Burkholderia gladioli TaxID=28095 RepID=UPI0016405734|nr:MFS transporter [Burkholderia gladioli]